MNKPAAIQGCYSDYRRVKGRAVLQLIIEVPIEQAPLVHQAFGEPDPQGSTWVGIALLQAPGKVTSAPEPAEALPTPKERKRFHELPAAQQAGMLCADPRFQAFLREEMKASAITAEDAAEWVRQYCQVQTRAHLNNHNISWMRLLTRWEAWRTVEAA